VSRTYPALDVIWSIGADDDRLGRVIAEIDEDSPTAVEEHPHHARIFFASPAARARAAVRLIAFEPDLACDPVDVPDESWAERSQASLRPVRVGRIVVAPPWARREGERLLQDDQPGSDQGLLITIQPSMGFGTAHHASTRLCLRLLQELPVTGRRVIDLGTGSAVLAISAAKLGAAHVLAVDHDPDALQSARENVELNGVGALVEVDYADFGAPQASRRNPQTDLVLANLTGALLIRFARDIGRLLVPGGQAIVSGVLNDEADEVVRTFREADLHLVRRVDEEEWVGVLHRADTNR
jgi:ribosomal protein L11 methyltransferase